MNRNLKEMQVTMFGGDGSGYPPLSELPDGVYEARFYSDVFEVRGAGKYCAGYAVERTEKQAGWRTYEVSGGDFRILE